MLLIVLMVVVMSAGLATFSAGTANDETRAVGGLRKMQRLRRGSESFLVAASSYLAEFAYGSGLAIDFADKRWTENGNQDSVRPKFGLPSYAGDTSLFQLREDNFVGNSYPTALLPADAQISDGAASPYQWGSDALIELYQMPPLPGQGSGQTHHRACVTAYTRMFLSNDKARDNDVRGLHELVVGSRAYFDVR